MWLIGDIVLIGIHANQEVAMIFSKVFIQDWLGKSKSTLIIEPSQMYTPT